MVSSSSRGLSWIVSARRFQRWARSRRRGPRARGPWGGEERERSQATIEITQEEHRSASSCAPALVEPFRESLPFPPKSGERGRGIGGKRAKQGSCDAVELSHPQPVGGM